MALAPAHPEDRVGGRGVAGTHAGDELWRRWCSVVLGRVATVHQRANGEAGQHLLDVGSTKSSSVRPGEHRGYACSSNGGRWLRCSWGTALRHGGDHAELGERVSDSRR